MAWHLNPFLTSFRAAVDRNFPKRGKGSDGTIGDLAHKLRASEHNEDPDGSVDAWDMDVNLLGSTVPTGTVAEQRAVYALLDEFSKTAGAQLWIYRGQIANRDVDNWKRRPYTGANKHDKHTHLQSRPTREKTTFTGDLDHVVDAANAKPATGPRPGSRTLSKGMTGPDVAYLQRWLGIPDDGDFGTKTQARVEWYQDMRGLTVDGIVGPATWREMGVTR